MKTAQEENNTLKTKLQEMLELERDTLKQEVIEEALEYDSDDDITCFFSDLFQHGDLPSKKRTLFYHKLRSVRGYSPAAHNYPVNPIAPDT